MIRSEQLSPEDLAELQRIAAGDARDPKQKTQSKKKRS